MRSTPPASRPHAKMLCGARAEADAWSRSEVRVRVRVRGRGRGRGRVRVGVRLTTQHLVQVGLPLGGEPPVVPMARVAGREIEIIGSHGLDASDMPAILQLVACGRLDPG